MNKLQLDEQGHNITICIYIYNIPLVPGNIYTIILRIYAPAVRAIEVHAQLLNMSFDETLDLTAVIV